MKKQKQIILPHVGSMLKTYFTAHQVNKAGLARTLSRAKPTVHKYDTRASLPCRVLWDISVALNHNFFADLSAQLPTTFTTAAPPDDTQARRIAKLEEENRMLTSQLELLKGVMGR